MSKGSDIIEAMTVKPSELKMALMKAIESRVSVLVHGSPGVGKSSIIQQVAQTLGREFVDIRLAYMDPVDLHGLPIVGSDGKMRFSRPAILPDNPDSFGIMLFDELTSAVPMLQVAAYQIILDGRVGEHVIEGDWARVGAGNLDSDSAVTYGMSSALANRFLHLTLVPDAADWNDWAMTQGISPLVIGYLSRFPNSLWEEPNGNKAFCTPRAWNRVSDLMNSPFQVNRDLEMKMVSGLVGQGEGAKFINFVYKFRELPHVDEIIAKPKSTPVPDDPAAQYAIAVALAYKATVANVKNILLYVQRLQPEMRVLSGQVIVKLAQQNKIRTTLCPEFDAFCTSIQPYLR